MRFFDLTAPLSWHVKLLAGATFLLLFGIGCYIKGREHGLEKYFALKSQVEEAQKRAEADANAQRQRQEQLIKDTTEGWRAAVDWYRAHPRIIRVLPTADCVSQTGPISASTGQSDDSSIKQGFDSAVLTPEQCEMRINNAILDAAQLLHLQSWVRQQRLITE